MSFQNPVDICNRAAQLLGLPRINDFNEDTLQAGEFSFVYDKLRRAELRRNLWQFSTRKAALRPVTTSTMYLAPVLWSSTTTYGYGAIVADSSGALWQSRAQGNLNNAPGNSTQWELYCGPVSVSLYDATGTTGYYAGELVYETPGDGSFTAYLSLQSGNSQDPRAPSGYDPTVQYAKNQVTLFYAAWAVGTTYAAGAVVSYTATAGGSPAYYISTKAANVGNTPGASTAWAAMNAALAPAYYNAVSAYVLGNMVTYLGTNYVCIAASTGNLPTNATYWAAQAAGTYYVSLIDFNLNQTPSSAPALWASGTTYAAGAAVGATDGSIYTSIGSGNVGHDPTATTGYWTNTGVLNPWTTVNPFGRAADSWLQLTVSLTDAIFTYPIGSGPSMQSASRNVFRLPANYMRRAPQDPKAGSTSFLGAPSGLMYNDWLFEGQFLISREANPIVLRFVADVTDVTAMDDMFCEMLASRVALETCERLTQSTSKKAGIAAEYLRIRSDAITVNGIETGPTESPEDDWITCRI